MESKSNEINETSINRYLRNVIKKNHGSSLYINDISITDYDVNYYYTLIDSLLLKTKEDVIVFNTICSILFLDSYKKLANAVKKNVASDFELCQYNNLSTITNSEELRLYYLSNPEQLLYGLDSTISFMELPSLTKVEMIKSLTREENARLNNITPLHKNDLNRYDIDIDKDYLYDFYSKYKVHLNKNNEIDSKKAVTVMVTNSIKNIYFSEPNQIKELINSISSDVFDNIESFSKIVPSWTNVFDSIAQLYQNNEEKFSLICLRDLDILEIVLGSYFSMKDFKIIKDKTYENK